LEKVKRILPNENYLYFGDLKNIPYGEKTQEQLVEFADDIFKFFERQGAKAVVMACNTTSATVYDILKDNYNFKIYPIIQSCAKIIAGMNVPQSIPTRRCETINCGEDQENPPKQSPSYLDEIEFSGSLKIGVFATNATINSSAYAKELKKYNPDLKVFEIACPEWVKIVEEKTQNAPESIAIVESYLKEMLKNNPDKIILGCTHYPYLLDILSKMAPRELFIDPSVYFADFIKEDLAKNNMLNDSVMSGYEKFFVSANAERFQQASTMFYPVKKIPTLVG